MTTFALISEGITDQVIIESIVNCLRLEKTGDEADFSILQPLRDATDNSRQGSFAGWELVLEYCSRRDRLVEALSLNDYIIVQIDTDCCDHPNFGIPLTLNGKMRPVIDIVNDVKNKVVNLIGRELYTSNQSKFIFAIAVNSLECWLVPFFSEHKSHKKKISSCEKHLTRILNKNGDSYQKNFDTYSRLAKSFKKYSVVKESSLHNESLSYFVNTVEAIP